MILSRRTFGSGACALALTACGGGTSSVVTSSPPSDLRPVPNAEYDRWVAGFRARAGQQGFSGDLLDSAFRGTGYLPVVVKRDRNQTEFKRSLEDYL